MALGLPIVSKFDNKGVREAETALDRLGGFARGAGSLLAGAFVAASVGAVAFAGSSLKAADESFRVAKGLEQAARNAGVFGTTDADIQKATTALSEHAQQLAELTGIDDEVLLSMEKTFLAVPQLAQLGTEGIQNLATVAADVAAGTGRDITSIGSAFIKVAGDAESAMSKLTRQGVVFSDEQKATYQAMLDANDEIGAQAYLIDQLAGKYDGMAEAMASPFDRLKVIFENLQETIGTAMLPAVERIVPVIQTFVESLTASEGFAKFMDALAITFGTLTTSLLPLLDPIMDLIMVLLPPLLDIIRLLSPFVGELVSAFVPLVEGILPPLISLIETLLPPIMDLLMAIFIPLVPILVRLVEAFAPLIERMLPPLINIITALVPIMFALIDAFLPIIEEVGPQLMEVFIAIIEPLSEMLVDLLPLAVPLIQGMGDAIKFMVDNFLKPFVSTLTTVVDYLAQLFGYDGKDLNVSGRVNFASDGNGGVKLASGGVVMPRPGGTLATIGEAGMAEAVIPLDRLDRMMGGGGGSTYVINVSGGMSTSAEIGRMIVDNIKKFERSSGPVFASA
jgi:phage-related protein